MFDGKPKVTYCQIFQNLKLTFQAKSLHPISLILQILSMMQSAKFKHSDI